MYFLRVEADFSAALYLSNCDERYKGMHGHDFNVLLTLYNNDLNHGMVYDYKLVKSRLDELAVTLDHVLLNDKTAFTEQNPTVENIAKYFYDNLINSLDNLPVYEVEVKQSRGHSASFRPTL